MGERKGSIEKVEWGGWVHKEAWMKSKIRDGWKINLYQRHCLPFPPPMHLIVNK